MATRDEYIDKLKMKLDEWNGEIGDLEAKFDEASEATKEKLAPHLAKIRQARDAAVSKMTEMKSAGEASWSSIESEVEHVWKTFRQSVNYFKSQL
jgi:hypothetical protein